VTYIGSLPRLLPFKVALDGVQFQAASLLHSVWRAIQVAMNDLIVSMELRRRAEQVAGVQEPIGVSCEEATTRVTAVLAPVTLDARTTGIKGLAAPVPAVEAAVQPALLMVPGYTTTKTITYTYDPLYRLTRADTNDGTYFRYTRNKIGVAKRTALIHAKATAAIRLADY
jgi:hypothetical protein